jgi:hypothetical protein
MTALTERRTRIRAHSFNGAAFARSTLLWLPDPKQDLILRSGARRVILNCSRQWGKSTVVAAKLVHVACTRPNSLSLIASENLLQTAGMLQKIQRFLSVARLRFQRIRGFPYSLELSNGSQVIGIAAREGAVRSYTADFIFLDEASRIEDEVFDAILPATGIRKGDWWMASTPNGRRGRFYETWAYEEGPDMLKVSAPWTENPRLSPDFIDRVRSLRGDAYVQQEFECQFIEAGQNLVTLDHVKALEV